MSENLFYLNHIHSALQYELHSKEKELATLPKGNLYTKPRKDGIHLCWSHQSSQNNTSKRQQKMLSEPYRSIAEGVQRQKFLNEQLPRIRNNLQLVDHCRTHYQLCDDTTIHSLLPAIYTSPLQYSGFETLSNFETPSPTKPFYSEGLIHKNRIGQIFRSKAEVSISEVLRQMNISYQYEPSLQLGNKTIYPDFKIDCPGSSRPKYIEYFGMVGHPEYSPKMVEKIQLYLEHGYIPGLHVLFLYESSGSGFDLYAISQIIEGFLSTPC